MKTYIKGVAMFAVGAALTVLAPQASATLELSLSNNGASVTVADGGALDSCAAVNCVTYNGSLGNYMINVSTGISNNSINPYLDLNSINFALGSNAGMLTIQTSQNGYTNSAPQFQFNVGGTSTLGGGVSFSAYGGSSNTLFDTSRLIGTLSFPASPYSGSVTASGNTVNPYSLTITANILGVNPGAASFNSEIGNVPEPATIAMLGSVLLFAGSAVRRKLRRNA
jgi:PEP-CTERM motif